MKIQAAIVGAIASLLVVAGATTSSDATRKLEWGQAASGTFYSIIAAVDYNAINGAELQSSSEGIESIGSLDVGDSLTYRANLPVRGMYQFLVRVSTPSGAGSFSVVNQDSSETYATITDFPATGDWEVWQTKTDVLSLPEGTVNLKFEVVEPGFNLLWMSLELIETEAPTMSPTTLPLTDAPTAVTVTAAPSVALVPDEVPISLPPAPALQNDMCLASMSARDHLMMEGCDTNSADGTISLRAEGSVLFSISVPTSGKYLLQMTVVRPSTGTLELVELQTQEQYAIVEHNEDPAATSEPKWSMVNTIVSLASGTHLLHMRSLSGDWTLSALCLQSIDSSNTCGSDTMINSSGPFVQEEAELVFGEQQEDVAIEEQQEDVAVEDQQQEIDAAEQQQDGVAEEQQEEFFEDIMGVIEEPSEDALIEEQPVEVEEIGEEQPPEEASEGTNEELAEVELAEATIQETPECTVFINANDYSLMEGISALNTPTSMSAIGFLDPGDYFTYYFSVPQEGTYELSMVVASPLGEGAFEVTDMATQDVYATVDRLPVTESWETWGTALTLVTLPSGPVSLMIRVLQEGWNLESLCLKAV